MEKNIQNVIAIICESESENKISTYFPKNTQQFLILWQIIFFLGRWLIEMKYELLILPLLSFVFALNKFDLLGNVLFLTIFRLSSLFYIFIRQICLSWINWKSIMMIVLTWLLFILLYTHFPSTVIYIHVYSFVKFSWKKYDKVIFKIVLNWSFFFFMVLLDFRFCLKWELQIDI